MRTLVLITSLALAATAFAALATPTASAFGWCTDLNVPVGGHCHSHVVCVGWSWDSYGERCDVGIREPICACMPMWNPSVPPLLP